MDTTKVAAITNNDYQDLALMVGELLSEIMQSIKQPVFKYNALETEKRAKELVESGKYWVFMARVAEGASNMGFVSMYESYALYSEGAYGTIPELYVRPAFRCSKVGKALLQAVVDFGRNRGWKRLEVTTPPLPNFDRTLTFYEKNGFTITGGRKLKLDIQA